MLPSKRKSEKFGKISKIRTRKVSLLRLADGYRNFEEGSSTFSDKKAEVASVDEFEIKTYTLKDFTVKTLGPHSALVTYVAHYEGKSGNEAVNANSVFGEVWVHEGNDWKAFYVQETTVK